MKIKYGRKIKPDHSTTTENTSQFKTNNPGNRVLSMKRHCSVSNFYLIEV